MAETATAVDDNDDPWAGVDATHLTGDLYFVDKYPDWAWIAAGIGCFLVPPAGVAAVVIFIVTGIQAKGDEVDVELRD